MVDKEILPGFFYALLLTLVAAWTTVIWYLLAREVHPSIAGTASLVVGLGVVGWLATNRVPAPRLRSLGVRGFEARHLKALVLLLPMLPVSLELQALMRLVQGTPARRGHHEWNQGIVDTGSAGSLLVTVVGFGLILPVVIEFFFRGLLQEGMAQRFGRGRGTLVVAALYVVFVLFLTLPTELISPWAAPWTGLMVSSLAWGLVLGAVRLVTGSLLATIGLHLVTNLVWIVLMALAESMPVAAMSAQGRHVHPAILVPSIACVALGLTLLLRTQRRVPRAGDPQPSPGVS